MARPLCPHCGAEVPPHTDKCPRCGGRVIISLEYDIQIDSLHTDEDFQVLFRDIMESAVAQAAKAGMILDMKRLARPRSRQEHHEISQLEQAVEDLDIRSNFFRYLLMKIEGGAVPVAKSRQIAKEYITFRDAQTIRFSSEPPESLSRSTIAFYEGLLASIEGRPTTIHDLTQMLRIHREKQRAAAGEPHISEEMQAKVNRFITATAMAKASRNVGMNPKNYLKQAQFLLEELRSLGYPRIGWLEDRTRDLK